MSYKLSITLREGVALLEGVESEPLFPTREKYAQFREEYIASVEPELRESDLARARSEEEIMFRILH